MEEISPQTPQSKRFQLSLKALFAAMVGASIYVGVLIAQPQLTGALTLAFLLIVCLALCFLKGFYWLGMSLMVFVGFIFLSATTTIGSATVCPKTRFARGQVEKSIIALVRYEIMFRDFPPNSVNGNSSVDLYEAVGKSHVAAFDSSELQPSGARTAIVSPWGFPLHYQRTVDANGRAGCIVIATGADGLLGGTLSEDKGFVPDNSDANGDGTPDHADNIISDFKP